MIQHKSKILTFTLLTVCLMSINGAAMAANVPAGTILAEKQELVRNNGSEPASLDPHKVESNVEFNLISDMFDGLVAVKQDGLSSPALRHPGRIKTILSGPFIYVRALPGLMALRLPHRMLSGVGSVWSRRKRLHLMLRIWAICMLRTRLILPKGIKIPLH